MRIIGHRGAAGLAPENTIDALAAGMNAGADMIEFDVRVTRDGVPVLHHDSRVQGTSDLLKISDHTYNELITRQPKLTTLAAALDACSGKHCIPLIEVKRGEPVGSIVPVIQSFAGSPDKAYGWHGLMIGSKSQRTLLELHTALPEVPVVVIEPWSGVRAGMRARQLNTPYISMRSWWLWRGFLRVMQRHEYKLMAYTMDDPVKVRRWQPYLYAVITNYPDRIRAGLTDEKSSPR